VNAARDAFRRLTAPLQGTDGRAAGAVYGGLALLGLYLYQGNHLFFGRNFPDAASGPFGAWAAHGWQFGAAFLLMFLVPLAYARATGTRPSELGLTPGDVRAGAGWWAVGALVLAVPLWVNAGGADFQAEYPLAKIAGRSAGTFALWELSYLVYYVAWEFFFRGFWQLGLSRALGVAGAMALQTAVSTIMHIGKPEGETLSAIAAGVAFGLVALRTRSILYVVALHWYVGMATDFFCLVRSGRWGVS